MSQMRSSLHRLKELVLPDRNQPDTLYKWVKKTVHVRVIDVRVEGGKNTSLKGSPLGMMVDPLSYNMLIVSSLFHNETVAEERLHQVSFHSVV